MTDTIALSHFLEVSSDNGHKFVVVKKEKETDKSSAASLMTQSQSPKMFYQTPSLKSSQHPKCQARDK
jgi:hypothetical protein